MYNRVLKFLCSIPIILILLYFIPFLGIILLIVRNFIYPNRNKKRGIITILIVGIVLLIPKLVDYVLNLFNINNYIFKEYITSNFYNNNIISLSKRLIIVSIV